MPYQRIDTLLIGGGIMSVTLASLIHQLDPSRHLLLVEQADRLAPESSDAFNNAGTGHAGYCEMNYTPRQPDGRVTIDRAVAVNVAYGQSLEYWANLVQQGWLPQPARFINRVPHISWVTGETAVGFLRERHRMLSAHPLFASMEWSKNPVELATWMPLILSGRSQQEPMAATRVAEGADVDFGALTRMLGESLQSRGALDIRLGQRVVNLKRQGKHWLVTLTHQQNGERTQVLASNVFVGAGGAALPLLQMAGVDEIKGYAGFPVSGSWLLNRNERLAKRHGAKVYGLAPIGAPPMSVPHLDQRVVNGQSSLLFGPFAGFTTRLLKSGHPGDLARTLKAHNIRPLLDVGLSQWSLTRYLVKEGVASRDDRLAALSHFLPEMNPEQWALKTAGQRVQIIKRNAQGRGVLEFGTEVVASADGSIATLLGASPGASTSVSAMLTVIERCFPELCQGSSAQRLQDLVTSWNRPLEAQVRTQASSRRDDMQILGLLPQGAGHWRRQGAA